jgi:hypothetical protein
VPSGAFAAEPNITASLIHQKRCNDALVVKHARHLQLVKSTAPSGALSTLEIAVRVKGLK